MLERDELAAVCPIFRDAERVIADPVVRNRGTIGGSLCQADPAEDLTTVCTVLDAVCLVRGPSGKREVPIDDFLEGPYETSLAFNEMLVEVRIPLRQNIIERLREGRAPGRRLGGGRGGRRSDARQRIHHRCSRRLHRGERRAAELAAVSDALVGRPPTEDLFAEAGRRAAPACAPASDMRGSADYKRHLAGELTFRTLHAAAARVAGTLSTNGPGGA